MNSLSNIEPLQSVDIEVNNIIKLEAERQKRKLIMIPSESDAPFAVRESLGSVLQNIYAEGYPDDESRKYSQKRILDIEQQILNFRRNSDPRYYKGVEFADILEELARRRCAELFANDFFTADQIFVNVQPLSGAPANNAVYHALIEPGDTILGMNLFHGGHLTHGSSVNRSGKLYKVFHYSVDPKTETIDYEEINRIAHDCKPKIIIAGFSSYPWAPDWKKFKEISSSVNAFLFADVSHIAGMIAAEALPSPVGYADVITFTTHKSLCGPRGACILSFDDKISRKIDKAVFPGEQGGPHVQVFAALATTFKIAGTENFRTLQNQILLNCKALSNQFEKRGIRIAFGGTNTHLLNINCKTIMGNDGVFLTGDMAARILDIVGIVANANTLPGDKSTATASGVRLGTPWLSQRGFKEADMSEIANIISDLFQAIKPYRILRGGKFVNRAKISFNVLENSKIRIRSLVDKTLGSEEIVKTGYPYFSFIDEYLNIEVDKTISFSLSGERIRQALDFILPINISEIPSNASIQTTISINAENQKCIFSNIDDHNFELSFNSRIAGKASAWLRDLSDGFVFFDDDLVKKIPGPFSVKESSTLQPNSIVLEEKSISGKPYFIGINKEKYKQEKHLPTFEWSQTTEPALKRTVMFNWHVRNNGKIVPFAGWEMPVWYSSVLNEHMATREAAGLFDVSHMGVYQIEGIESLSFLDSVCANDISSLKIGESCYTHFLDQNANVIDDLLVYHHNPEKYLLVVNAANDNKDWAWLNSVKEGKVKIDNDYPHSQCYGRNAVLRNLKDPGENIEMKVDLALQGPLSKQILLGAGFNKKDLMKIDALRRTELCHAVWQEFDLIISRTGYTGEKMAFEIFIHPEAAELFWNKLIEIGDPLGLKPCGLGARDSLRTEAGLPLYGHEMGGELQLGVGEAGFNAYIKTYKPWFIGRTAFIQKEINRKDVVIRFRFENQRVRMAHLGDPVFNEKGKVIGIVTSCAIDSQEYLTGQALLDLNYSEEMTPIYIYQNSSEIADISPAKLKSGDRVSLPSKATVVSRFARL